MRLYIRKDVAAQIWKYGVGPSTTAATVDPTEGKFVSLTADAVVSVTQPNQLPMKSPHPFAFAKDGTIYVADSGNNRILHIDQQGNVLKSWGAFADGTTVQIGAGTFNEIWGIAIGADGSVYATDTWNHRIEKFTPDVKFILAWGTFGQAETPDAFYGPRGLAADSQGRIYVMDTGNKRVVVFDANGVFITQFGTAGLDPGQFDEPVGITLDKNGTVYVTDTWNQRVQTFTPTEDANGLTFTPGKQWDVYGWFGQSLDNKPYIAVNDAGHVFITDPEGYRVMEFDADGKLVRVWGENGTSDSSFGLPSGIAVDSDGHIWVSDSANNRLMRFTIP
jgi:DNA-binding beta-propeller fold protein YncE